jgi:peptide/nickel transport system substrate-binding protein
MLEGRAENPTLIRPHYLLLLVVLLSGCSRSGAASPASIPPPSEQNTGPVPGDWITYYMEEEPDSLNPVTSELAIANTINLYLFEPLVQRDPQTAALSPGLAQSWEISPDKLTYTFHLRPNVTWSDGQPFTAEDVKFTMDRLLDPKTVTIFQSYFLTVKSYEVIDPLTIRFHTTKPYYRLLESFNAIGIIPEHGFAKSGDFNTDPRNRNPIGTGPYRFVRWVTGSQVILERRDDYWGTKALPKRLVFQLIEEPSTALQLLKKGEVDVMDNISPLRYQLQLAHSGSMARLNTYTYTLPWFDFVGFNLRRPIFSDVRVRHAIDLLMPRAELQKIGGGPEYNVLCSGSDLPTSPRYDPTVGPTPYDPARAAQLLDEAGWKLSDRDGFRYREGKRLEFTLIYIKGGLDTAEELMQESLQKAGIQMHLEGMDGPRLSDEMGRWDFDAFHWGWISDLDDDPFNLWHSSQAVIQGSSNNVGYQSKQADQLLISA